MLNQIDLSRLDLNLLVVFETVMEELHVGRTALRLNLSPSAISHALGRLRGMLGDPLFLRTPKGVVPTERARDLQLPISEILARIRGVMASAEPFDPARSTRRFMVGAPDGVSAVFLPALLDLLAVEAPGVALGIRQVLPAQGEPNPELAWREVIADLDARAMDIAIMPYDDIPVRFERRQLFEEDFVVAARKGHPYLARATLDAYCEAWHLVVSHAGDAHGFVDTALATRGLSRRVTLTVPNFMFALPVLSESDLISALPRRFVERHGARYGIAAVDPPMDFGSFVISIVTPQVAMHDAGVAWLVGLLERSAKP